jgi:hypothetical protein
MLPMLRLYFTVAVNALVLLSCHIDQVQIEAGVDREIVLIDMGYEDRKFIGELLLKIDSCKPKAIVIVATFLGRKDREQDSVLITALQRIKNDLLIYSLDSLNRLQYSDDRFRKHVMYEGLMLFDGEFRLVSHMRPVRTINGNKHTSISLQVVKLTHPSVKHNYKPDQRFPISYTKMSEQLITFYGSDFDNVEKEILRDKIVILGYLDTSDEKKYRTPLRFLYELPDDEPDTYSAVILANEIRTLIGKKK